MGDHELARDIESKSKPGGLRAAAVALVAPERMERLRAVELGERFGALAIRIAGRRVADRLRDIRGQQVVKPRIRSGVK